MPPPKRIAPRNRKRKLARTLIHCVIFDLDDTLYDCLGQRVRPAHRHAAEAMVRAGLKADVEAVYRARMRAFRQDPTLRYIDEIVCRQFGANDPEHQAKISRAARDAYFNLPVNNLKLFRGSLPLLRFLERRGVRIFIVSFGEPEIQRAKVRSLGLEGEPAVEAIFYADRTNTLTKEIAFRRILKKTGLPPWKILVIGDRPMSEIRSGKKLGMRTVRLKRGEFAAQEPAGPQEQPDYVIRNISEVRGMPYEFGSV
ncbi:MAG TPA: HAD family hydrolase [Candidatus Saccharimonadales bacterium]|jgi:FMN phosphatase YigB (HAD superfamily)|nr:HAD family hydrolase [Candidatus Saccharimonadales bacterium]